MFSFGDNNPPKINKIVKIKPDRGYGDSLYRVLSINRTEVTLKNIDTNEKVTIYSAHTYYDIACMKKELELRDEINP